MKNLNKTIIALLCLINVGAYAQQIDAPIYEFYGSLTKNLKVNFKPVSVMIKVDVDKAGQVSSIAVSDNAESDFRTQFEVAKPKLNMAALNKYVTLNKLKDQSFMIPYYITSVDDKDKPHHEPLLTKFNGINFKNKAKTLSPIKATYSVTTTTTTSTKTL